MRVAQLVGVLLSITPDSTANLQGSGGEETSSGSDAATPAPTTTTANPGYHRGNRPMTADEWAIFAIVLMMLASVVIALCAVFQTGPFSKVAGVVPEPLPHRFPTNVRNIADVAVHEMKNVSAQVELSKVTADIKLKLKLKKLRAKLNGPNAQGDGQGVGGSADDRIPGGADQPRTARPAVRSALIPGGRPPQDRASVVALELELANHNDATNLQIAAREAKINAMLSLQEKKASLKQKKQAHASISELTEAEANAIEFDDTTGVLGSKTKSNP